jgi:type II secretory pathway component GspD/PulD (secretin)
MASAAGEKSRELSERDFLVAQFMKYGDEARERADWAEAQKNYVRVLEVDPGNELAKTRLDEASAILGVAPATVRSAMDRAVEERQVQRQAAQAEISDLAKMGRTLESEGNYDLAITKYEKALLIVGLFPYYGDFSPGEEQLKDMIASARAHRVQAQKDSRDAAIREANLLKEADEKRMRQARDAQIMGLFRDANLAMERMEFDVARTYAEQILVLDPTNDTAARLTRIAREARLAQDEQTTRRNLQEQWQRAFEDLLVSANPQVQPVVFPDSWLQIQDQRKPYAFSRSLSGGEDPRAREIENILAAKTVNINYENTSLQEAIKFLAEYAEVNIIVLPKVFEEKTEDELSITLKADGITVASALDLITLTKGLSYRIEQGVVQIGTAAEGLGKMLLDLYDVKDLTVPIQSFPGEDINLVPSGGFGFGFEEEATEPQKAFEGDALAELIRSSVDPEVWDAGGDVAFREGGILIVKAPTATHRKIVELLNGLRATGGLTVQIETRFITVVDSFLQEIGVDLRGLGDQSGGLGIRGKGVLQPFDDVLSGSPGTPSGIGTGSESGVFYNLNSDGDIRGRVENLLDVALGRNDFLLPTGGASIQATYLDDTQLQVVLRAVEKSTRATIVTAPKLTVYNHSRANITVLNQVSYIQDFDVEIAQAAQIGDPIVQTLRDGVILDVTPIVSADRKYVTLELRPTVALLKRPIQTFTTTLANGPPVTIQLPEINIQRVRTTVTMPDGGILLLGGLKFFEEQRLESSVPWIDKIPILSFFWSRKGTFLARRNLIVLIKAKILVLEEMEPRYGPR